MLNDADDEFEAMSDLCIEGCRAALARGTPEMRVAARLLLEALARELARRERASTAVQTAN